MTAASAPDAPTGPATAEPPLLAVRDLDKSFFATHAVDHVSFDVHQAEIVALLGENGAGKSTVIKMLAGVYKSDSGDIRLLGDDIDGAGVRKKVSFIHQTLGLIEWMTVAENIALSMGFPRTLGMISERRMNQQAEQVLEQVGGGIDPRTRIFDLPRTERSLLAIARALVGRPRLLVLDEPTASLPQDDVERLFTVVRRLRDQGTGMIYVSHRLDEIYQITSRAVIMRNGRLVADTSVEELSHADLVELIVGHETRDVVFDPPQPEQRVALSGVRVGDVGPIDLQVRRGEIIGLCGLRGAGHAEVGRAVAGVVPTTAGTLTMDGRENPYATVRDAITARVGFVTSNRETESLAPGMSVRENLFLNPSLWGTPWYRPLSEKAEAVRARQIADTYSVRPRDPELAADTLSGGNQQKVILARWLALGRDLVVLEEPTMGVDVGAKSEIYALLRDAANAGTTVVVVTTDLEEASLICHRALVFERGAVAAELTGDQITIGALTAAASGLAPDAQTRPHAQESAS